MLCLCVAGCARQAGLESKSVLPAIADLYVQERLAVLPRTASYGPGKCALGPWHGLESVGIGLRGVIFFAKNACTCMEVALFSLARAEVALAKKLSLCTPCALRGLCAGVLCKLACICVVHTPLAGRAWQAGLESKSDLWVICIQEIQARAAESVRSARCAPVKLYECSVSIIGSVAGKRVRSVWI